MQEVATLFFWSSCLRFAVETFLLLQSRDKAGAMAIHHCWYQWGTKLIYFPVFPRTVPFSQISHNARHNPGFSDKCVDCKLMLNFLFQIKNIQHVQHLPDILSLQKALIHFFQNCHGGEIYSVQQFLDQHELSGMTWTYSDPSKLASTTQYPYALLLCYSRTCDFSCKL